MNFYMTSILLVSTVVQLVAGAATLTLPTSANCGDPTVLTCTSSGCTSGYRFIRNGVLIYDKSGPQAGISDPDRYSTTLRSDSEVQLTITNIQYSDVAQYACNCGFNTITTGQTLVYQCKASDSKSSITSDKKLLITMDMLYPEPSSIVTTNTTNTLQGAQMCRPSSTLAHHFNCSWDSTSSFPDGIHSYTITVTTLTQAAPLSGFFRIVTPASPNISSLGINNQQGLQGVQDTPLTIKCVSQGGIPAPTLAWYRGNTSTSPLAQSSTADSTQQSDGTYTVNLTYNFTPNRTDDLTPFLCRVFYPGATSGASPDPLPASAKLYLNLKPVVPDVSQTGEAVSGKDMTLRCTSDNNRPPPNITWAYHRKILTLINTSSSYDPTSETYTVVSVLQSPVSAEDNGHTVTCMVTHTTLSAPLNGTVKVDVKFGPKAKSTTISGNQKIPATGNNQLRLNCTSGSSNPASDFTWFNGSDILLKTRHNTSWTGENNGLITSNILTITPTRYMDGDKITCRPDNGYGNDSSYVELDVQYSPLIRVLENITAIEDVQGVKLNCSASSKPPAMFAWYKGDIVLARGMGKEADNSLVYVIPRANRTDTGSYRCQANNTVGSTELKDVLVFVKYPPTVTVSTDTSPSYIAVTCNAEGYPTNYEYQDWVQIWPGYGTVATIPFTGTTLTLINATYERSGVYACSATNGVSVYHTGMVYIQGNTTILIKSQPIITEPFPDSTCVPVSGKLGQNVTTDIKYWSNVGDSVVSCYKLVNGSRLPSSVCSVAQTVTKVMLPVYSHMVHETGTLATVTIPITRETDLTDYDVVITNSFQGESLLCITIVPHDIKIQTESASVTPIAGIVVGVCTPLVIGGVILIIFWRRKAGRKHPSGKDTRKRSTENATSDVVECECAVYESAGPSNTDRCSKPQIPKRHEDVAGLYAVVSKPKKEARTVVHKSRTTDVTVYAIPEPAKPQKNINRDGLVYAELEFNNNPKRSTIHGLDNTTTYVQVDFSKLADPLPDSDDETMEKK